MCDQPQELPRDKPLHRKRLRVTEPQGILQHEGPADVAIWTRVPPPIGGMTVHVSRLIPILEANGITVQAYSVIRRGPDHPLVREVANYRLRWFLGMLFGRSERLYYVLGGRVATRFAAALLACLRQKKVILRVGNRSLAINGLDGSIFTRWMTRFAVRHASAIIGVNPEICELARQLGASHDRVHHIPGFIPPEDTDEKPPQAIQDFIATRSKVLLASGQVNPPEAEDVYGIQTVLDVMSRLKESRPDVGLIFYSYQFIPLGPEPVREMRREIARRDLSESVMVYESMGTMSPTMKSIDVMIRPTTTDGDSNAVREAISLGAPVIASDCVPRPESILTYPAGDTIALCDAIVTVLDDLDQWRAKAAKANMGQNADKIVQLVKKLLGE